MTLTEELPMLLSDKPGSTVLAPIDRAGPPMDPSSPEFREHVERGAAELARIFDETTASIRRHWTAIQDATAALDETMKDAPAPGAYQCRDFKVELYYDGAHEWDYGDKPAIDTVIKKMAVKVWGRLIDRLGIKNLMSVKRREAFEEQIRKGDVPEVTEENIISTIMGMAEMAADFATEAAKEALAMLTPHSGHYKTNSGFKVGRRVVLTWMVERQWSGDRFRANYRREPDLIALDGTFHVLDEKGPIRGHKSPLILAIESAEGGRGETDYFKFRCFKNRNLHLEFRRPDLVKKLNGLATGEYVLGQDLD